MAKLKEPSPVDKQVETMAGINCTWEEIAAVIGMSVRTAKRRFGTAYKKGVQTGRMSLKRKMWETAQNGNVTMMIWLSKQMLGYTDKVEEKTQIDSRQEIIYESQFRPTAPVQKTA